MRKSIKHPRRLTAVLALLLVPVGAVAAMTASSQSDAGRRCEIRATQGGGMVKLDALVQTDKRISGNYAFRIEKSGGGGSSVVNQNGAFNAGAGETATLGSVTLDSQNTDYKATLDIKVGDRTLTCTRRTGGA